MPVSSTIPLTEDYREATLAVGEADNISAICLSPDYLFAVTEGVPAKLVRLNRNDFSVRSVITFANDDEHKIGVDIIYVSNTAKVYVLFRNGPPNTLMISEVTPATMATMDFWREEDFAGWVGSLTSDGTNIYATCRAASSNVTSIAKQLLAGGGAVITALGAAFTFGRNLRWSSDASIPAGALFVSGVNDPPEDGIQWLAKVNASTLAVVPSGSTTFDGPPTTLLPNNIGLSADSVWVGQRGNPTGIVRRFLKSNLTLTEVTTGIASLCRSVEDESPFVWSLLDNGRAVRINPSVTSLDKRIYALNSSYHHRLISGDPYLFGSVGLQSPSKLVRYRIPSDVVPGGINWVATAQFASGTGIAGFSDGGTLLVGTFSGTTNFGSGDITSAGGADVFIIKYNTNGTTTVAPTLAWPAIHFGTSDIESCRGVAVDASDNFYIVGAFKGTVTFVGTSGSIQRTSTGSNDIYVAKYNSSGGLLWVNNYGGSSSDEGQAITIDRDGNIIIGCTLQSSSVTFGAFIVSNFKKLAWVKLNPAGTVPDAEGYGNGFLDVVRSIDTDGNGDLVVIGDFAGTTNLGGVDLTSLSGTTNVFVAKYSGTDFSHVFSFAAGGTGTGQGRGIAVNRNTNNFYITGHYEESTEFKGTSGTAAPLVPGGIFWVGYDSNGALLAGWKKTFNSTLAGYNAADAGQKVVVDTNGNVTFVGKVFSRGSFGAGLSSGNNLEDHFIVSYTSAGIYRWSTRALGTYNNQGLVIGLNGSSLVTTAGSFQKTIDFGNGITRTGVDFNTTLFVVQQNL